MEEDNAGETRQQRHKSANPLLSIQKSNANNECSTDVIGGASLPGEPRRHSTRSVKRKKFDDELVESSLTNKQERLRTNSRSQNDASFFDSSVSESVLARSASPVLVSKTTQRTAVGTNSNSQSSYLSPGTSNSEKLSSQLKVCLDKKKSTIKGVLSKSKVKQQKKLHGTAAQISAQRSIGRWKPQDDLLLIQAVQQTCDLRCVHLGVKFSCNFSMKDIEDRWYALLYNEKISKVAMMAIQQLPNDEVTRIQAKALFNKQEEDLLGTVKAASQPTLSTFSDLLNHNIRSFHHARTPKSLLEHWTLMKQYHLLPDQSVQPLPKGDHILNFSDAEDLLDDAQLLEPANDTVQREMALNDRRQKKEIRYLEQELPKWQVLVESITGTSQPEFDNQTLAILRGRLVRYLMRSKEISIGRVTKDNQVDVDLSLEGPAYKISRKQGSIKLRNSGEFILTNTGKRPIFVDSKPVLPNSKVKLHNNSVIEVTCLRFIFIINQDLIKTLKTESQKPPHTTPVP